MKLDDLCLWFDELLNLDSFEAADPSRNGLQVTNSGREITRIAFAVDACLETIKRAAQAGAGMLFVHHGMLWKEAENITGRNYNRIKALLDADLALYACHLPLDAHPECGNNSGIAAAIGLESLVPFGEWHGQLIGFRGSFAVTKTLDSVLAGLFPDGKKPAHVLPFGPELIRTVGIVSGGAAFEVHQAIEEGLDLYITGEIEHEIYHAALESKISVIAGGHYQTETFGPRLVAERLGRETSMDTVFVDVPTGL